MSCMNSLQVSPATSKKQNPFLNNQALLCPRDNPSLSEQKEPWTLELFLKRSLGLLGLLFV